MQTARSHPHPLQPPRPRHPEIDVAKGVAIFCVLLIHADPLAGTRLQEYVVNRAVPVLLVLFGASSELWWRRHDEQSSLLQSGLAFVRARYVRLLPQVWAALGIWWALRVCVDNTRPNESVPAAEWLVAHALGYIPQVGTGWFVTLIVQLVVLVPLLRWLLLRAGTGPAVVLAAAIHVVCQLRILDVVDIVRALLHDSAHVSGFFVFYYSWIFAPARLLLVLVGMLLARHGMRTSPRLLLVAAGAWTTGYLLYAQLEDVLQRNLVLSLMDLPLTLLWLAAARAVSRRVGAALAWLGRESWGVYLGQLLVHTSFGLFGYHLMTPSVAIRFAYVGALFAGGVVWVLLGDGVVALWRAGRTRATKRQRHADEQREPEHTQADSHEQGVAHILEHDTVLASGKQHGAK